MPLGDEGGPVVRHIADGQARVEVALIALTDTVNRKFDELGQKFMPRQELTTRFEGITDHQRAQDDRLTLLEAGRDVDRTAIATRVDKLEERRRIDLANAKVVALALLSLAITALTLIVAHWK